MRKIIAIHSSRGGTGKTTIAANLTATFAQGGLNITLLDLDFRAPSLFGVFSKGIKKPVIVRNIRVGMTYNFS